MQAFVEYNKVIGCGNPKQTCQQNRPTTTMIWGLAWHPQGHMLASMGNDWRVRFWGKPKPYEAASGPPAP